MIKANHILLLISVLGVIFFNYEIKKNYHQKEKEILKLNNLISEKKQNILENLGKSTSQGLLGPSWPPWHEKCVPFC